MCVWKLRCGTACNECFSLASLGKLSLALCFSVSAKLISCVSSVSHHRDEGQLMSSLRFKVTRQLILTSQM